MELEADFPDWQILSSRPPPLPPPGTRASLLAKGGQTAQAGTLPPRLSPPPPHTHPLPRAQQRARDTLPPGPLSRHRQHRHHIGGRHIPGSQPLVGVQLRRPPKSSLHPAQKPLVLLWPPSRPGPRNRPIRARHPRGRVAARTNRRAEQVQWRSANRTARPSRVVPASSAGLLLRGVCSAFSLLSALGAGPSVLRSACGFLLSLGLDGEEPS